MEINMQNWDDNLNSVRTEKKRKVLIIGGVAAGTSAAAKARRIDPEADIKIIQEESVVSYGACGIPYVIEGLIGDFCKLIARPAEKFEHEYKIDIIENTRAVKINAKTNRFMRKCSIELMVITRKTMLFQNLRAIPTI